MAPALDAMVVLGTVVGSYGVRGWVRIKPHTEAPDGLLGFPKLWLKPPGASIWQELAKADGRMHSGHVLMALQGSETREEAMLLKGAELGVPRAELPASAQGEVYLSDLVGLSVINRAGQNLGEVAGISEHGAHPLLRVDRPRSESIGDPAEKRQRDPVQRLIPYVPAIVDRVDLEARTIEVDWGDDY